jgi:hypothetical protein
VAAAVRQLAEMGDALPPNDASMIKDIADKVKTAFGNRCASSRL